MDEASIFLEALEKPAPADRAAYLDGACAGDVELRRNVEMLLKADAKAGDFLNKTPADVGPTIGQRSAESPGTVIGPYKLLQQIGEGGMGVVWMAEQTQPVQRKVALKVIKPGMDSRQVIARFEAERQALAMMDHVNIARVLDAGTTESGLPYFVMELVHGVPITQYCDDNHLTPRERLELFVPVCQAIQHAHQKGIIHRDIKPSNVMITLYDGKPVAKVIDFGVAKATEQTLTERTLFTQYGTMVGTLEYMSPEQAEMSALGVDTRSDIFSLGVLLYELLTGSTPLTHNRLKEAAYAEVLRMIREEEPPKPSTRLSESGEAMASISAQRHMEPAKLTKLIRGELDWIVMKCLEKDRNRRYETASGFAADVQRYLADESVQACPPSAWYRFRKFARRYKGPVAATILILLCLIGGIIGTSLGMMRALEAENATRIEGIEKDKAAKVAQEQAAIATSISESLKQMLGSLVPSAGKGPDYTARQMLDDYADNLETKLADQPEIAADLHIILGRAYACLDARDKARQHLERGLVLRRNIFGDHHEKYAEALVEYARPDATFEWARCEADLRRALAIFRERGVGGEPVIYALYVLQWLLAERARSGLPSKWDEVETVLQEGLAEARRFPGQEFPKIADLYSGCACAKMARGHYAEAETITREALAMGRKLYGLDAYPAAWGYFNLADALRHQGKFREATQADKHALAIMRKVLPPGHKCTAWALIAALKTFDAADEAHALATLFASVAELGDWESVFLEVLATTRPGKLNDDDPVLSAISGLARCGGLYLQLGDEWAAAGKSKEAEEARRRAAGIWDGFQTRFAGDPRLLPYAYGYGTVALIKAGQPQKAKELCRKLLDERLPQVGEFCNNLAWFLATTEIPAHRDPFVAIELAKKAVESDPKSSYYHNTLGVARYRAGDWKQAIAELEQSMSLGKSGDNNNWFFLAMAQWQLGHKQEARKRYDQAAAWMEKNQPKNDELSRFRAEAKQLLGIEKKED